VFDLAGAESRSMFQPSTCAANGIRKCRKSENVAAPSFRHYHILELGAARFFILAKLKVPLGFS